YIVEELPSVVEPHFGLDGARRGISGHSMGGHGALWLALRHPDRYRSLSAFAPIASPTRCPWGQKALRGYLGDDASTWAAHDVSLLAATTAWTQPILIDQGDADPFLEEQLRPSLFAEACERAGIPLTLRMQP